MNSTHPAQSSDDAALNRREFLGRGVRFTIAVAVGPACLSGATPAEAAGTLDRAEFLEAGVEDLGEVPSESVDIVTTRSVLIYVEEKERAFREFHRVLRPGGRISLFEPINRFGMDRRRATWGYALDSEAEALMAKVTAVYEAMQPETDPMIDFDERDMLELAEATGFFPVTLDYRSEIESSEPRTWQTFVPRSSGGTGAP